MGSRFQVTARDSVNQRRTGRIGGEHSYLALDGDRVVSAILVSRFDGIPLLAYAMTARSHKGRGLAMGLTRCALESLRRAGDRQMHLWVTAGNADAEHIYERLGFRDVAPTLRGPLQRS